ncbi:MAG: hypothetical protein HQL98_11315 [Magnetococcales bacterium]|nr:hypothetical protein [Magnetococcales bacterium]
MKRPLSDPASSRIDTARFEQLPDLSLSEAAWLAGVAEEAMQRYLEESNTHSNADGLPLSSLMRALFMLLGRKETQASMLRQQLTAALERERELSDTLRTGLLGSGIPSTRVTEPLPRLPDPRRVEPPAQPVKAAPPAAKKKKKK